MFQTAPSVTLDALSMANANMIHHPVAHQTRTNAILPLGEISTPKKLPDWLSKALPC